MKEEGEERGRRRMKGKKEKDEGRKRMTEEEGEEGER